MLIETDDLFNGWTVCNECPECKDKIFLGDCKCLQCKSELESFVLYWAKYAIQMEKKRKEEELIKIEMNEFVAQYCTKINIETSDWPLGKKES